jgi:hypothetical protein
MNRELVITVDADTLGWLARTAADNYRSPEGQVLAILAVARARGTFRTRSIRPRIHPTSMEALIRELRVLHSGAGHPSTRAISERITRAGFQVSHSTVHAALAGKRPISWGMTQLIVEALGGDASQFRQLWLESRTGGISAEDED